MDSKHRLDGLIDQLVNSGYHPAEVLKLIANHLNSQDAPDLNTAIADLERELFLVLCK